MDQSPVWGLPRYATLAVVLMFHALVLALLLRVSETQRIFRWLDDPLEVVFVQPANDPKIRLVDFHPQRLSGEKTIWVAPLVLGSGSPSPLLPATASEGDGSGVDWKAEARRAVQAFEIRKRQPVGDTSLSGSPAEETWWPRSRHHAGERYKTPNGDWIVWINANCYQVASSVANPIGLGALLPPTVCVSEPGAPRRSRDGESGATNEDPVAR